MAHLLLAYGIALILAIYIIRKIFVGHNAKPPLPPGPKGLPLVGNISDLPPQGTPEWKHWLRHKDQYGPLSSVTVFGQTIILVHDKDMAMDLFEKQAIKYSSRPHLVFSSDMCGYGEGLAFLRYDKELRQQRKLCAIQLGHKNAIRTFEPSIDLEMRRLLLRNLNTPDDLVNNTKTLTASIMLKMLYGYTPSPHKFDPLVAIVNQVMDEFSQATASGAWLVDLFPLLRYVPDWVPGTEFKQTARAWKKNYLLTTYAPLEFVKHQMAHNIATPSFVAGLIGSVDRNVPKGEMSSIRLAATSLYGGGSETTVAVLSVFHRAMMMYPHVQRKAQEEIDRVVGTDRLPSSKDIENLPYLQSLYNETLRWHPIPPLSLPRIAEEESEYRGYRIPKGAIFLPSIAWFAQDPAVYHEPQSFKPERFSAPHNEPDPHSYTFGFGRRLCPGRLLADSVLLLTMAGTLAAFDIKKAVDENGKNIEPPEGCTPGIVSHPMPFQCRLEPRSEKHAELIRIVEVEHPWAEGDAKFIENLEDRDWSTYV